jgi:hypothetical protein
MRRFFLTLALLQALGVAGLAATYSLQIGDVKWTGGPGGYSCFSSTAYPNTIAFTITKLTSGTTTYAVAAGRSTTTGTYSRQMAYGANRINYQLYTGSSMAYVLEAPPAANASQVISGSSSAKTGQVLPLTCTWYVPPNQRVPPGTYTDQIQVRVIRTYSDNGAPQDTRTITLSVVVLSGASLSLVASGSPFDSGSLSQTLNFGTLRQGLKQGCDLLILKNTACRVTFSSANLGALKNASASTDNSVAYACQVDGGLLDLTQPATVTLPTGVSTSQDGTRLPVAVTIGDPSAASAGDYRDDITITATAL